MGKDSDRNKPTEQESKTGKNKINIESKTKKPEPVKKVPEVSKKPKANILKIE